MKGIAIQTILLILIGVIVIGIMAYLIYKAATTKTFSVYECKAKLIDICRMCQNADWDPGYPTSPDIITECSKYAEYFYWSGNTNCNIESDCQILMGTT